jgi:hypothetical protein
MLPPVNANASINRTPERPKTASARLPISSPIIAGRLPHTLHPVAQKVLNAPAPAGAVTLVSKTNSLAADALAKKEPGGGIGDEEDSGKANTVACNTEPFRSVLDNAQGWGRSRFAIDFFQADAAKSLAIGSVYAGRAGETDGVRPNTSDPSNFKSLFDPLPEGSERDPVMRAMLRIQRARVLSASHAQGVLRSKEALLVLQRRQLAQEAPPETMSEDVLQAQSRTIRPSTAGPSRQGTASSLTASRPGTAGGSTHPSTSTSRPSSSSHAWHVPSFTLQRNDILGYTQADLDPIIPASSAVRLASASQQIEGAFAKKKIDLDDIHVRGGHGTISAQLKHKLVPSTTDLLEARLLHHKLHNEALVKARKTKHAKDTMEMETLSRKIAVEARITTRSEFNARQRKLITMVYTMRACLSISMAINDERERKRLVEIQRQKAAKIIHWYRGILKMRYVKSLEKGRKLIKNVMRGFIVRWRTLKFTAAARLVAKFLIVTEGMSTQTRVMLAYKRFTLALGKISNFLRKVQMLLVEQVRINSLRFHKIENTIRRNSTKAIAHALEQNDVKQLPISLRLLMQTLFIKDIPQVLKLSRSLKKKASGKRDNEKVADAAVEKEREKEYIQEYYDMDANDRHEFLVDSLEMIITVVPDYNLYPEMKRFLKYRMREHNDIKQNYRKKAAALAEYYKGQRKKAEFVQRWNWNGPASAFVLDTSSIPTLPRIPYFKTFPTTSEIESLVKRVTKEHYDTLGLLLKVRYEEEEREALNQKQEQEREQQLLAKKKQAQKKKG